MFPAVFSCCNNVRAGVQLHAYGLHHMVHPVSTPGAGREQLVQQLLQRFPERFASPRQVTDRRPGKGEKEAGGEVDFIKPDVLAKMAAQGQVLWSAQDAAGGSSTAITSEAVGSIIAAGEGSSWCMPCMQQVNQPL
jgi:guanylate kinase